MIEINGIQYLTAHEAAEYLGERRGKPVAADYLNKLARRGKLSALKLDARKYLYPAEEVAKLVVARHTGRSAERPILKEDAAPATLRKRQWSARRRRAQHKGD